MSETVLELNDGNRMPAFALGTLLVGRNEKDVMYNAIKHAVKQVGYHHIDCALIYQNEEEVGRAFKDLFDDGYKREDLFVTSKLWNNSHESVEKALDISLKSLNLDYLDLYLMHWPIAFKDGDELVPKDRKGNIIFSNFDYLETWRKMIDLKRTGKVRSIGVSNFNCKQLQRLIKETGVSPVVNQVECHPYLPQKELLEFSVKNNIVLMAYAAIGRPNTPGEGSYEQPLLLKDKMLGEIAKKHKKSPAQVLLRFHLERNCALTAKSITFKRLKENFEVFDFNLTNDDLNELENLKIEHRYCPNNEFKGHKYYPFEDENQLNDESRSSMILSILLIIFIITFLAFLAVYIFYYKR